MISTQPVEFRKGHGGLAALVSAVLRNDPFTGTVFCIPRAACLSAQFARHGARDGLQPTGGGGIHLACHHEWGGGIEPCQFEALFAGLDWRN